MSVKSFEALRGTGKFCSQAGSLGRAYSSANTSCRTQPLGTICQIQKSRLRAERLSCSEEETKCCHLEPMWLASPQWQAAPEPTQGPTVKFFSAFHGFVCLPCSVLKTARKWAQKQVVAQLRAYVSPTPPPAPQSLLSPSPFPLKLSPHAPHAA